MKKFRGGVSLGLREARSGLFALVRKEISAEYGKTQSHKGNCRCSWHCLGESSDIRSSLDQTSMEKSSFAIPIRGLANKAGKLVQPIQLR